MLRTEIKYFNSYEDIANKIYVPSFQRDINIEIINDIKLYIYHTLQVTSAGKEENYSKKEIRIGVLEFGKFNGNLYVIDGNHRITSIKEIYEEKQIDIGFYAMIYTVESFEEMKEIFKIRNYSMPVPEFILNPPTDKGEILKEIQRYLLSLSITKINKITTKVNRPFIDLNKFMAYITNSDILMHINNLYDFKLLFNNVNNKIRKRKNNDEWRKKIK